MRPIRALSIVLLAAALLGASPDWRTPAEISGYRATPRYDDTIAFLRRLAAAAPGKMRLETFGTTGEGRGLVVAVVSRDGVFDPAAIHAAGRPVVLIQNAIHAGEMDGKDACLALLRDMLATGAAADLLGPAVLVVIPIYNADGHERFGPWNRINQNGPDEMGFRTQGRNLNLNRDYLKADAPETRAFLRLWNRYAPDLFVDDHVTDGADYRYDVTFGITDGPDSDPAQAAWARDVAEPYLRSKVDASGHLAGPFIDLVDPADPSKGLNLWGAPPRFSNGYAVVRNRLGMLVEMHMLKDYRTRVTGNTEILRALVALVNRDAGKLVAMNRAADAATVAAGLRPRERAPFPLTVKGSSETEPFLYEGVAFRRSPSEVSGRMRIEYTGAPADLSVPRPKGLVADRVVAPPRAYVVPAPWTDVIGVLEAHGVAIRRTSAPWAGEVETYRCEDLSWAERPYEGRHPVSTTSAGRDACVPVRETLAFPPGSAVVPLDQPAAKVAIHFLEPMGPDSAVAWGFFDAVFEQKEYGEAYVLERVAREMRDHDPKLREAFESKLASDPKFAADGDLRLDFFFRRSPWWDRRTGLYPVGRLATLDGLPLEGRVR